MLKVNSINVAQSFSANRSATSPISKNQKANEVQFRGANQATNATKLASAYQAMYGIKTASSVNFGAGLALSEVFDKMNAEVVTCADPTTGAKGEKVGTRVNVTSIVDKLHESLPSYDDAVKTNIKVSETPKVENEVLNFSTGRQLVIPHKYNMVTEARTQVRNVGEDMLYEMAVRQPRDERIMQYDRSLPVKQKIGITLTPNKKLYKAGAKKMQEEAYILNTKGNMMAIIEDNSTESKHDRYVLLTDTGRIEKRNNITGTLVVDAQKDKNVFTPFVAAPQPVRERHPEPSIGEGTEIVIGMENGRFVPEIIDSIATFEQKINNGEIVLDTFVAAPEATTTQLAMLAGGFGSRAEYANAASDGIFHGNDPQKGVNGAQSTKGVFRTPTGLTPMETTFVTLHNAGLLDCSKGNFGIGKNVKFYLNKSGINKGNGGFTIDMYDKMAREGRENLLILPNDPISRVTNAMVEAKKIIDSGDAAMVMIAKKVDKDLAKDFGVMRLGENNEILEFVEKPKNPSASLIKDGKCMANTFQFAVSKEAFAAIDTLSPYFPAGKGKEPRDWSKCLTPVLMTLTQKSEPEEIKKDIAKIVDMKPSDLPTEAVVEAKNLVGDQKIIAVPTDEPWADCGSLNQLYHTTMQIASGDFPLEDFERANVLKCVNTQTGLVATTPELKDTVEAKYDTQGQVLATHKAEKVSPEIVRFFSEHITVNR